MRCWEDIEWLVQDAAFLKSAIYAVIVLTLLSTVPGRAANKPNILIIMGDNIGWMQVGVYHRGIGLGETPNINRIANESQQLRGIFSTAGM